MLDKNTKSNLETAGLKPIKHSGQNFLISEEIIEKIISSAKIKSGEIILEVGPGTGNLTNALLSAGARVIAVEKDRHLAELLNSKLQIPPLRQGFEGQANNKQIPNTKLQIINSDILKFDETAIKQSYRVIANIPYYLTGPLIQKFLFSKNKPAEMILMAQQEVGERITAEPPKMNYLSAMIQSSAGAEILFYVKKDNFWPMPKVDSVVIRLIPHPSVTNLRSYSHDTFEIKNEKFIEFLKMVFKQPRKTLFNNLRDDDIKNAEEIIAHLGLDKNIRAQNLSLELLKKISELVN